MSSVVRFNRNRIIRLRHGQSVTLVCGTPVVTRRITLRPGQFVVVTCDASQNVIIVGCQTFITGRFVSLRRGQRLIVTCSS
jgi:hypothetical protein